MHAGFAGSKSREYIKECTRNALPFYTQALYTGLLRKFKMSGCTGLGLPEKVLEGGKSQTEWKKQKSQILVFFKGYTKIPFPKTILALLCVSLQPVNWQGQRIMLQHCLLHVPARNKPRTTSFNASYAKHVTQPLYLIWTELGTSMYE